MLVFVAVWAFSSCSKQGLLFVVCEGFSLPWLLLLQSVSSRQSGFGSCSTQVLELQGFSNHGTWTQVLLGMWDLPRPGIEPVSPALASIISTTGPPGKFTPVYLRKCGKMPGICLEIVKSSRLISKKTELGWRNRAYFFSFSFLGIVWTHGFISTNHCIERERTETD